MRIIELTYDEAAGLYANLADYLSDEKYRTMKFNIDGGGLKWKEGEGMWTPSVGHDLPGTERKTDKRLRWMPAHTDDLRDQYAPTELVDRGYWQIGPESYAKWSVSLVIQDHETGDVVDTVRLPDATSERSAKVMAETYENEEAH